MDAFLAEMMAEPRWLMIIGLALDMVGAVLVAGTHGSGYRLRRTWVDR